jgi:hypothetical protein
MNFIKRTTALAIILLSSVLLLVCLVLIAGVWFAKHRLDGINNDLYKAAVNSLAFMDERLDRIETALKNGNKRVGRLSDTISHLPKEDSEIKTEATSLLQLLDKEVFEPLRNAETWIDSTRAVARGVKNVSEAVLTSEYAKTHNESLGVAMAERLRSCSESLAEILTILQEVRQGLIDMRDNAASARRIAAGIVTGLARIDLKMADLSKKIGKIHAGIAELKSSLSDLRDRFQWWTAVTAVSFSLLFIWFAASQIGMIVHGYRFCSNRSRIGGI